MSWDQAAARAVGERIRLLRTEAGLSQEALAHLAGVTKNRVQLIESGRGSGKEPGPSNPRLGTLYGIAEALGVKPSQLID